MLITTVDNKVPEVGELFYVEHQTEDGEFEYASLSFIDEEPKEDSQWMYTQIAIMEDLGEGMEVYAGFEAGGMPKKYTRLATDDDIKKFVDLMRSDQIAEDSPDLENWINQIDSHDVMLEKEKERIKSLASV